MTFDLQQLDNLDYDDAELLLEGYVETLTQQFDSSPEGQAYAREYPEVGGWIRPFIEYGYTYEGFTLPKMTVRDVELLMESLLPRKITLMEVSEAEEAIPELVAFWSFLQREYNLKNAAAIITYLRSIKGKFGNWMMDPNRGGMAKNFIMSGMKAGFDMSTQEGLTAFQQTYNAQVLGEQNQQSFFQKIAGFFNESSSIQPPPIDVPQLPVEKPARKTGKKKPATPNKGFGSSSKSKSSHRKKK